MIELSNSYRDLAMSLYSKTMVGDEAPNYEVKVTCFNLKYEPTYVFNSKYYGVISVDTTNSEDYGASSATVVMQCVNGATAPDFSEIKFPEEDFDSMDIQAYKKILNPENAIQISLGYGDSLIPILTGAIDKISISADGSTITMECRDNMRYLVDQTIDPVIHGRFTEYPKPDGLTATPIFSPIKNRLKVINADWLNLRTGPDSSKYNVVCAIQANTGTDTILEYLLTNAQNGWHNVVYTTTNGERITGWVSGKYTEFIEDSASVTNSVVDGTDALTNSDGQWLASSIVMDLAVEALTVNFDLDHPQNRTIANVYVENSIINDAKEGIYNYTIEYIKFPIDNSYFTACMEVVNKLGNTKFRCNRFGDIWLYRTFKPSQNSTAKWVLSDVLNLTSADYTIDVLDMRDRILVKSDNGWSLFENKFITEHWFNGIHRTCSITANWADTSEKRAECARSAYVQMLCKVRNISVAFTGNPLIEVGDVVQLYDLVTTATAKYMVVEYKHSFTTNGFITSAELQFITEVGDNDVQLITEEFPVYKDDIKFYLKSATDNKGILLLTSPEGFINRCKIEIVDPETKASLAFIEVTADYSTSESTVTVDDVTKVVCKVKDTNLRSEPILNDFNIEKVVGLEYTMTYVDRVKIDTGATDSLGEFYKVLDSNGTIYYAWADNCIVKTSTTYVTTNNTVGAKGVTSDFINIIRSQLGKPYIWGATGPNSFDCSGLIVYAMRKLGLMSTSQRPTANTFLNDWVYPITKQELQPGDLFFCHDGAKATHVGVYVHESGGELIHAPKPKDVVRYGPFWSAVNKYGRLKKLVTNTTSAQATVAVPALVSIVDVNVVTKYLITSNFDKSRITEAEKAKALSYKGEVLLSIKNHILYKVIIDSSSTTNNQLKLYWCNINDEPVDLDLLYKIAFY